MSEFNDSPSSTSEDLLAESSNSTSESTPELSSDIAREGDQIITASDVASSDDAATTSDMSTTSDNGVTPTTSVEVTPQSAPQSAPNASSSFLLPAHRAQLEASHIAPDVAAERGYCSIVNVEDVVPLGFPRSMRDRLPALGIPVCNARGEKVGMQLRPDRPRFNAESGKPIKQVRVGQGLDSRR